MVDYILIRSKRKSLSLRIDDHCQVVVRAPQRVPKREIDEFVSRQTEWIDRHMPEARRRMEQAQRLTPELLSELTGKAEREIPPLVRKYAAIMDVKPTGVRITRARKRFGSCSGRNSLCFSCLLMLYPPEAVECVVVHELAHIRHHDHSPAFYGFIDLFMPDYCRRERLLRNPPEALRPDFSSGKSDGCDNN